MIDEETVKSIEALHRLKQEGIISEEEFEKSKQRALFGRSTRPAGQIANPPPLPDKREDLAWMTLALRRYADFNGRSCRKEFWMFAIIPFVLTMLIIGLLNGPDGIDGMDAGNLMMLGTLCLALAGLAVPHVAVQVRRLHDQDRTGWLALINLIPYVGPIVMLVLMAFEGTEGENQYGPDPLAP